MPTTYVRKREVSQAKTVNRDLLDQGLKFAMRYIVTADNLSKPVGQLRDIEDSQIENYFYICCQSNVNIDNIARNLFVNINSFGDLSSRVFSTYRRLLSRSFIEDIKISYDAFASLKNDPKLCGIVLRGDKEAFANEQLPDVIAASKETILDKMDQVKTIMDNMNKMDDVFSICSIVNATLSNIRNTKINFIDSQNVKKNSYVFVNNSGAVDFMSFNDFGKYVPPPSDFDQHTASTFEIAQETLSDRQVINVTKESDSWANILINYNSPINSYTSRYNKYYFVVKVTPVDKLSTTQIHVGFCTRDLAYTNDEIDIRNTTPEYNHFFISQMSTEVALARYGGIKTSITLDNTTSTTTDVVGVEYYGVMIDFNTDILSFRRWNENGEAIVLVDTKMTKTETRYERDSDDKNINMIKKRDVEVKPGYHGKNLYPFIIAQARMKIEVLGETSMFQTEELNDVYNIFS